MAKQLKPLETENSRQKKMVAEPTLDMEILKEDAKGNWYGVNVGHVMYLMYVIRCAQPFDARKDLGTPCALRSGATP